jgi:hypothetical protein
VGQIIDFRGKVAGTKPYALGTMPYVIACDVRPVIKNNIRTVLRPCDVPPSVPPLSPRGWDFERPRIVGDAAAVLVQALDDGMASARAAASATCRLALLAMSRPCVRTLRQYPRINVIVKVARDLPLLQAFRTMLHIGVCTPRRAWREPGMSVWRSQLIGPARSLTQMWWLSFVGGGGVIMEAVSLAQARLLAVAKGLGLASQS